MYQIEALEQTLVKMAGSESSARLSECGVPAGPHFHVPTRTPPFGQTTITRRLRSSRSQA